MKSGPHGGYPDPPKYGIAYLSIGFYFLAEKSNSGIENSGTPGIC